jgi:hypothetical protein
MIRTLRRLAAALGLAVAASALSACGPSSNAPVSYAPAAYYQVVNNVNECYYVQDPAEATALMRAGLCPSSIPTLAPQVWLETYWNYYESPAYYNTYMPVSVRHTYISVTVVKYNHTPSFTSGVRRYSASAVYRGSNGSTVRGYSSIGKSSFTSTAPVGAKTYGGGSRNGTTYGGGSRSCISCHGGGTGGYSSGRSYSGYSAGRK